jgi:protein-tyrosine-phosphatase
MQLNGNDIKHADMIVAMSDQHKEPVLALRSRANRRPSAC